MRNFAPRRMLLVAILFLASVAPASAGGLFHFHEEKPHPTPEPGARRHFCNNDERAGYPHQLAAHVQPTDSGTHCGHFIGGGGGHGSGPRFREEGTWGWDYTSCKLHRHIFLGWNHGRYDQGGTGAYQTDGCEVPNVFAQGLFPLLHHGE